MYVYHASTCKAREHCRSYSGKNIGAGKEDELQDARLKTPDKHRSPEPTAAMVTRTGIAQDWPCQRLVVRGTRARGAPPLTPELLAAERAWGRARHCLCCAPTAEPSRLQWAIPNPRSHRPSSLNSGGGGHEIKQIDYSVRKSLLERRGIDRIGHYIKPSMCLLLKQTKIYSISYSEKSALD